MDLDKVLKVMKTIGLVVATVAVVFIVVLIVREYGAMRDGLAGSASWLWVQIQHLWPWALSIIAAIVVIALLVLAGGNIFGLIAAALFIAAALAMLGIPLYFLWTSSLTVLWKVWVTIIVVGLAAGYGVQKRLATPNPMFGNMILGLIAVVVFLFAVIHLAHFVRWYRHETQDNSIVAPLVPRALDQIDAKYGTHLNQVPSAPVRGIDAASEPTPADDHPITTKPATTTKPKTYTETFTHLKRGGWRSKATVHAGDLIHVQVDSSTQTVYLWGRGSSTIPVALTGFHSATGAWVTPQRTVPVGELADFPDVRSPTGALMARIGDGDDAQLFYIGTDGAIRVGGVGEQKLYFLLNEPQTTAWWELLVPGSHIMLTTTVVRRKPNA